MMRQFLVFLIVTVTSCRSHNSKHYQHRENGMIVYNYQFSEDSFHKISVFELERLTESGRIVKNGKKINFSGDDIIDTFLIYHFEKSSELGQKYYIDFSNIAISKCNQEGRSLKGGESYKMNDVPIFVNHSDPIKGNVMKFEKPLVKIEAKDSFGNIRYNFVYLIQGKILKFRKLQPYEEVDDYFTLSLTGSKIKVYSKFIGTGNQKVSDFKKQKKVYKRIEN